MALLDTFPVSLKVAGRRIVVVGGGLAALNKTRLVLRTSARIEVWARKFDPGFFDLPRQRLTLNERARGLNPLSAGPHWLAGAAIVFVADRGADGDFAEVEGRAAGVLVNVVDNPDACDFYTPAIVDRAPLSVAIMTEGAAPVIGRRVRAAVEAVLSPDLGALVELAGSLRDEVAARLPEGAPRRRYYERLAESGAVAAALAEGEAEALTAARALLDTIAAGGEPGSVAWVGAGPGAEDLLTLRAQRLLQGADIIFADVDVPDAVVDMGRRDAERIVVVEADTPAGRVRIGARLVALAEAGQRVVRLVAGDPRRLDLLAEETGIVRRAGIFVSIVPGIASEAIEWTAEADAASPARQVA